MLLPLILFLNLIQLLMLYECGVCNAEMLFCTLICALVTHIDTHLIPCITAQSSTFSTFNRTPSYWMLHEARFIITLDRISAAFVSASVCREGIIYVTTGVTHAFAISPTISKRTNLLCHFCYIATYGLTACWKLSALSAYTFSSSIDSCCIIDTTA